MGKKKRLSTRPTNKGNHMDSPITETEFLLQAANTIVQRHAPDASHALLAEVFRRLCAEADQSRAERGAALH